MAFLSKRLSIITGVVLVIGSVFLLYKLSTSNQQKKITQINKEPKNQSESSPPATQNESKINKSNIKKSTDNDNDNDEQKIDTTKQFPIQVFTRIRPLIKEEIVENHQKIKWKSKLNKISNKKQYKSWILKINITSKSNNKSIKINSKFKPKQRYKTFKGFKGIITEKDDNIKTFKKCILPSINSILNGNTVCSFAYGHTGSGKTHTILGYGDDIPGLYRLTAKYICNKLNILNKDIIDNNDDNKLLIQIRCAEIYQGKVRDLLSTDLVECFIREDDLGEIHIRGPTIRDKITGKVRVYPLTSINTLDINLIYKTVSDALKYRNVGSSTLHDQSSRSHAFLQFEIVTNKLIKARNDLIDFESDLVPIGKERDNEWVKIHTRYLKPDEIDDDDDFDETRFQFLEKEVKRLEEIIKNGKKNIENIQNKSIHKCLGGSFVFIDLAGNEYGNDAKQKENPQILKERKEINKSLLCLKECIRALHNKKKHIPYRDSKLTMVLRPHLKGDNSVAIMIANISPSQIHSKKTFNTLSYSQLIALA